MWFPSFNSPGTWVLLELPKNGKASSREKKLEHSAEMRTRLSFACHYSKPFSKHQQNAFTLVELLIMVVILGIAATIVVPYFATASRDAKLNTINSHIHTVQKAMVRYNYDHVAIFPSPESATVTQGIPWLTRKSSQRGCTVPPAPGGVLCRDSVSGDVKMWGPYLNDFPQNPQATRNTDHVQWGGPVAPGEVGWLARLGQDGLFIPSSFISGWEGTLAGRAAELPGGLLQPQ